MLVALYWRPGCPWCALLRRGLRRAGIATMEFNIWEDPDAAAKVREVAGGNETVPTVFVGEVALVNPSVATVRKALEVAAGGGGRGTRHPSSNAGRRLRDALRRLALAPRSS